MDRVKESAHPVLKA
uniref:Uncharacterized protein n=1 Tax=Anguilla anguilla TaxID=7936 RepID=A0A0E9QNN9_ANGAN